MHDINLGRLPRLTLPWLFALLLLLLLLQLVQLFGSVHDN
jgi:hypothetical protein